MKRIALYATVLLIAGVTLALSVSGVFANSENASCTVNGTCSENCTCPDKEDCTGNCTCLNNATIAQSCSSGENSSGAGSCPLAAASAQTGCGTAGKGCPVNTPGKSCGAA